MTRTNRTARMITAMVDRDGDGRLPRTRRATRAATRGGRATERHAAIRESATYSA